MPAAIADFTEAIRLDPKSASAFNRRGLAYRRWGDLARAIDDYTQAITINPIYALAYNNRGYVYEAQGRKDDAISTSSQPCYLIRLSSARGMAFGDLASRKHGS